MAMLKAASSVLIRCWRRLLMTILKKLTSHLPPR
jgi:hypothetical protein